MTPSLGSPPLRLTMSLLLLAVGFTIAGALHLIKPGAYMRIMPPWLPAPAMLVLISGVAEMAGGLGLILPQTRVAAGWGLIALLIAVFPANVQMLFDAISHHASRAAIAVLIARLPLQPALIWWVWRSAIRQG